MAGVPMNTQAVLADIQAAANVQGWGENFITAISNMILAASTADTVVVEEYYPATAVGANTVLLNVRTDIFNAPNAGEIVWMQPGTSAVANFSTWSPTRAMLVGDGGNSTVNFQTTEDVAVQLTGGQGDVLATGRGNDTVAVNGGTFNVNLGDGDNNLYIGNGSGATNGIIQDGNGSLDIEMRGHVSGTFAIKAGGGFDELTLMGRGEAGLSNTAFAWNHSLNSFGMTYNPPQGETSRGELNIAADGLDAIVWVPNQATQNYRMTVLADTVGDSLCAKLYQVALGRQPFDAETVNGVTQYTSTDGIKFWTTEFDQGWGYDGVRHTVYAFLNLPEFHSKYDNMDDAAYISALFGNLGATGNVAGKSQADFVAQISGNGMNARYDAAWEIAASHEAVNLLGNAGAKYVIDGNFDMVAPLA